MLQKEFLDLDRKEIVNALVNASKFVSTDPTRPQFLRMVHVLDITEEGSDKSTLSIQATDAYTGYIENIEGFEPYLDINDFVNVDDIPKLKEGNIEDLPTTKTQNKLIDLIKLRPATSNVSLAFNKNEFLPLLKGLRTVNNYQGKNKNISTINRNIIDINIKQSEGKNNMGTYNTTLKVTGHYTGVSFEIHLKASDKMQEVENNNFTISCDLRRLINAVSFFENNEYIVFTSTNNSLKAFELSNGFKSFIIAPVRTYEPAKKAAANY